MPSLVWASSKPSPSRTQRPCPAVLLWPRPPLPLQQQLLLQLLLLVVLLVVVLLLALLLLLLLLCQVAAGGVGGD